MRKLLLPLLLLAACATTSPPPVVTPEPCNAGHSLLQAVLWTQVSAEHDASTLGIFANARRALDAALADPTWVGAAEETANDPTQPPAVILDLDETVLDNAASEIRFMRLGKTYDRGLWKKWVAEAAALEVPGAKEFLLYAKSRGVMLFYISNRDEEDERLGTRRTLENLGFPLSSEPETILLRGGRPEWGSDKGSRRAYVAASYRVLLVLGDDLNDFAFAADKTNEQRDAVVAERKEWWGTRWFMIPNPMYGSWEKIVAGTGTPCEQVDRKMKALNP
jgi:5'-nucleotidase (lipoprotein e(P4) family)